MGNSDSRRKEEKDGEGVYKEERRQWDREEKNQGGERYRLKWGTNG